MVRLKGEISIKARGMDLYFNSTMVRLKASGCGTSLLLNCYFNSTMVRLKVTLSMPARSAIFNFNSTMVRLKGSHFPIVCANALFQFHYGTIKRIVIFADILL